ncbi:hypothetical protein MPSEU_000528900 [Mayamaea pseudoterrestris]|nr:hypothetical protein MPSEU_000528900 [Mayamaea pseudoterrestris]
MISSSAQNTPRLLMRRSLSTAAALRRKAIAVSGAPPSISAVAESSDEARARKTSIMMSQVGCTRRVFLLDPYLNSDEVEGLAYRIRALTRNDAINSVLIATDASDSMLPSSLEDLDYQYLHNESADPGFGPEPGKTYFVAGGYDALRLYTSGAYQDGRHLQQLLTGLSDLALACRGDASRTKVPVITVPHGAVEDAGFSLLMSSYVMATSETTYSIQNPSKGLSLDPVGLSYMLPRLGQEFQQPSAAYPGCGLLLGLFGYVADANDLVETGLATNFMESIVSLGDFERTLAQIPPWNQQALVKKPVRFYGYPEPALDHNHAFRNVAVADAVHCFSRHRADGAEMWNNIDACDFDDPSLETDPVPWHEARSSSLVDYAATFDEIFRSETTAHGLRERFCEIAGRFTNDPEVQEGIDVAADFVARLDRQSPLAISVIHKLLTIGSDKWETLRSCMERERKVQANMFKQNDFKNWAQSAATKPQDRFAGWKHKSLRDVLDDETQTQQRLADKQCNNDDNITRLLPSPTPVIYDPYYCDGRAAALLRQAGFSGVVHEKRDFYQDIRIHSVPHHDVVVTNPPYSDKHKQRCFEFCFRQLQKHNKPFFVLLPAYVAARQYYKLMLEQYINDCAVIYLIPAINYEFSHPEGTGHKTSPFQSLWFCGIRRENIGTIHEDWKGLQHQATSCSLPTLATSISELEQVRVISTSKRPNPKQRRKKRDCCAAAVEDEGGAAPTALPASVKTMSSNKEAASSTQITAKWRDERGKRSRRRF